MFQRSTKGASKQRRDCINSEINVIRDCLPVGENVQRRLSQLQVMALCNSYIAKTNCFHNALSINAGKETFDFGSNFDFTEALPGFLMVITMDGRLLYVSENVTEYLGHSMVDLMTQAETIYDIIERTDQSSLRDFFMTKMTRGGSGASGDGLQDELDFTCRMNLGNIFRRSNIFDRHKTMKVHGQMIWPEGYLNLAEPIFVARCTSVLSCSSHENATAVDTMMFQSCHSLDMKFTNLESNGEFHLGYSNVELKQQSWYQLIHPDDVPEAVRKHQELTRSGFDTSKSVCVRVQTKYGHFIWLHVIMRITTPISLDSAQQEITCLNHVISEKEAYETKNREGWEEIMSLTTENSSNMNRQQGQDCLPTVVLDAGFFDDSKAEVITKPVECNREELMKKLRNKAQEKGFSKAKRVKHEPDSSSRDSHGGSSSSSSSESRVTAGFNHGMAQNFNGYSEKNHVFQQMEPNHYRSTAQHPYQFSFGSSVSEAILYSDNFMQGPLTPAYSVESGSSSQEDCMTYTGEDSTLPSFTPTLTSLQASAAFSTPPFSPQSDAEEYQSVFGLERSFFESITPMNKAGAVSSVKKENFIENQCYLPELPCEEVANFFDSFECHRAMAGSTFVDLIGSPFFAQTVEMMCLTH